MTPVSISQDYCVFAEKATLEVFETMVFMAVEAGEHEAPSSEPVSADVVASLGFTGTAAGSFVVYSSKKLAWAVTANMLGMEVEEIETADDVSDAIGEICNMVAGNIKNLYVEDGKSMDLAVPMVSIGDDQKVSHPNGDGTGAKVVFTLEDDEKLTVEMRVEEVS